MNQAPRVLYHPHIDNLSILHDPCPGFWGRDIVQLPPCSLDLVNEIGDGVPLLCLEDPAFTSTIEDSLLTLHLFHISSCTHTLLLLIDTVQLTLQLRFELKIHVKGVATHEIPFLTVSTTFCSNSCAPSSSTPSASGPAQSLIISHGILAAIAQFCAVLRCPISAFPA